MSGYGPKEPFFSVFRKCFVESVKLEEARCSEGRLVVLNHGASIVLHQCGPCDYPFPTGVEYQDSPYRREYLGVKSERLQEFLTIRAGSNNVHVSLNSFPID